MQVVILGAGFDARALRLREELAAMQWLEVDFADTQSAKRDALNASAAPLPEGPMIECGPA